MPFVDPLSVSGWEGNKLCLKGRLMHDTGPAVKRINSICRSPAPSILERTSSAKSTCASADRTRGNRTMLNRLSVFPERPAVEIQVGLLSQVENFAQAKR